MRSTLKLLTITAIAGATSCTQAPAPVARTGAGGVVLGGSIGVNLIERPTSIDPRTVVAPNAAHLAGQVHLGLLRLDPLTLMPVPAVAESFEVSDSGTTYLFTLRNGVRFHADACFGEAKGRTITAEDVVYSFNRLCAPDSAATAFATTFRGRVKGADEYRAGTASSISGITLVDVRTVRIDLLRPDQAFALVLASPATAIIPREAVEKYGDAGQVGAGAFMLRETDGATLLVRNPDHFALDAYGNALPYLDTVRLSFIQDKRQELEAFFAGELDIVTNMGTEPVKDLLEQHMADFSGESPKYVMTRNDDASAEAVYTVYRKGVKGFSENFMRYRDYSAVQHMR
jgi:oligopeptide transport system substrate-binding protein